MARYLLSLVVAGAAGAIGLVLADTSASLASRVAVTAPAAATQSLALAIPRVEIDLTRRRVATPLNPNRLPNLG